MNKKSWDFKVGDEVRYYPVEGRYAEFKLCRVTELVPEGVPSCREPMLKLDKVAGVVLASHCLPNETVVVS